MPTPTTYASQLTYAGLAPETSQGTPVMPTSTIMLTKDPASKDNQVYLEDLGLRNSMGDVYGAQLGPLSGDVQLDGDVRTDTIGYLLGNVMGDWTQTGTATGTTTTTTASNAAGAASITNVNSIAGFSSGQTVQFGSGATAEVFVIGTPSGTTIPLNGTSGALGNGKLAFAHGSGQSVTVVNQPSLYKFALQNAGTCQSQALLAQSHSLTVTDWSGVTAGTGARAYPGAMFSDITFTIDATKLLTFTAKATTWGSAVSASTPAVTVSGLVPTAGWTAAVGIGGPASGGTLVTNVSNMTVTLTRAVKLYPTLGSKNPYIIRQGKFGATGKFNIVAADETALINYLTNVQPQLQILMTQGSGATLQSIQFDLQQVFYKVVSINRGNEAIEYDIDFTGIANTTNVGGSGGFGPLTVTVGNNISVGTY